MKPTNFMKSMSKKRLMGAVVAKPMKPTMKMDPEMAKRKKKMMGVL